MDFLCMTSSFSKPPFSSVHMKTKTRRFEKSLLWRALLKRCVFGDRFTGYGRTDYGRWAKLVEKHVFKQTRVSVDGALNTHVINIKIQQ